MKQDSILSHHEELRLDYLRKNIHYLNDKEKRELEYLEYKSKLPLQSQPTVSRRERYHRSRETNLSDLHSEMAGGDAVLEEIEYDEILPEYPRHQVRPKQKSISKPNRTKLSLGKKIKRISFFVFLVLLLCVGGIGFMFIKGWNSVEQKAPSEVFQGENTTDGVNILILGTDGRVGESSEITRTDSIMVLNLNHSSKKIKLISFMRDTLVNIAGYDYKLNTAYTLGEQNNHQGAENVRQVLKENFDINIRYYALVDFSSFATAIDTLFPEGVFIDAQFSTVDGQVVSSVEVPDDLNMNNGFVPQQTIATGPQQMDGRTLLNYARFRKDDEGDFGRTRRQQQVLSAILLQSKNPLKLFSGSEALGKIYGMTSTNVPRSFMVTNGIFAALDAQNGVERLTVPEIGDWVDEYDVYGGLGLKIDFEKYKQRLAELGLR